MAKPVRRIVTGHNQAGKSIILSDGSAPNSASPPGVPELVNTVLWITDGCPASNSGNEDEWAIGSLPSNVSSPLSITGLPSMTSKGNPLVHERCTKDSRLVPENHACDRSVFFGDDMRAAIRAAAPRHEHPYLQLYDVRSC